METSSASIFITGANGGLGLETAKLLAKQGFRRITLAARTLEKSQYAKQEIEKLSGQDSSLETAGGFDMNNPQAIESAVAALPTNQPYDIIFLQVGGVFLTKDYQYVSYNGQRIEKTVFQNVIGGYITLENLKKHGLLAPNARIVFAGGEGARGIPGMIQKPIFETAVSFRDYIHGQGELPTYNPMNAIGVSKLASALLVQRLATQDDGHTYLWFSPGLTHGTKGLATMKPAIKRFIMEKIVFGVAGLLGFSQSPQQGARKYLDSLIGKIGFNGDILGAPEGKVLGKITDQCPMNPSLRDPLLMEEFWRIVTDSYQVSQEVETMPIK